MSDIHSINEAINKRAGRKLFPSIIVSLSLIALIWFALAYHREIFALVVAVAVVLGIHEIVRAFNVRGVYLSRMALIAASLVLSSKSTLFCLKMTAWLAALWRPCRLRVW